MDRDDVDSINARLTELVELSEKMVEYNEVMGRRLGTWLTLLSVLLALILQQVW